LQEGKNTKEQALASEEAAVEEKPPLTLFEQNFLHSYTQKAYFQHLDLILMSEYFGCIPGTPRILEVSGEVQEFRCESRTGALSREKGA